MTHAQEAAIARVCAHECLQQELVEALLQAESLIDTLTLACLDRVDTSKDERLEVIRTVLAKARGEQQP